MHPLNYELARAARSTRRIVQFIGVTIMAVTIVAIWRLIGWCIASI